MTFVGQILSDKIAAARRRSPGLCRTRKVKVEMVTYFDEKHCREYECIFYDPDIILCCKRNFKDPADGMDACCEPPDVREDGFHALLDKNFSEGG